MLQHPRLLWAAGPTILLCAGWLSGGSIQVRGCVLRDGTHEPIAGARVGIQGRSERVETDCAGRFCLRVSSRQQAKIVAWSPGHFIAGTDWHGERSVTIRLQKHPVVDSADYSWADPNPNPESEHNCANCHAEIYRQWSTSSHARSAVNRRFLDMFAGTDWTGRSNVGWNFSRDHPDAKAVCSACHLPTVPASDPVAEDPRLAVGITREGIHCDFCHKIAGTDLAPDNKFLGLQHGRDALRLNRPAGDQQIFFGPLDDVDRGRDTYSPLYRSSYYCASCHEGTLFGTKAYETFSEWSTSSYARRGVECQHCHMQPDGVMRNFAPGHGGIDRDPATLATHHFAGSADESLLRSSVDLRLFARQEGNLIRAAVSVRSVNVGHRLPTGSPDRNMLLLIQATDDQGQDLALQSGPVIPPAGGVGTRQDGNFAGTPGKLFGKLLGAADGSAPEPFWRAVALVADTRLHPDVPDLSDFAFKLPTSSDRVHIRATLIYRRFYKVVLDEKSWPDSDVNLASQDSVLTISKP